MNDALQFHHPARNPQKSPKPPATSDRTRPFTGIAVVNSADTNDTGMHHTNGSSRWYSSVIPGPEVVTCPSSPNGPPVVYEYITKMNGSRLARATVAFVLETSGM